MSWGISSIEEVIHTYEQIIRVTTDRHNQQKPKIRVYIWHWGVLYDFIDQTSTDDYKNQKNHVFQGKYNAHCLLKLPFMVDCETTNQHLQTALHRNPTHHDHARLIPEFAKKWDNPAEFLEDCLKSIAIFGHPFCGQQTGTSGVTLEHTLTL